MELHRSNLPQTDGGVFLAYTRMETDFLFTQDIDLPGFTSYPLLETDEGRAQLRRYFEDLITIAREAGAGIILESPKCVANRERGAAIGYSPATLKERNVQSVVLKAEVRDTHGDPLTILSANLGPRVDAYASAEQITADKAEQYHAEQIGALAETEVDLISGYTVAYPEEAIGMVRAAQRFKLPVIIAFTVETDGCLPTGLPFEEAIETVDEATGSYASYFMINRAHPDRFSQVLSDAAGMTRLKGVVSNASRSSHAELDEAEVLDDGNPEDLGNQLAEIHRMHPNIKILGRCCGADMRHMACFAQTSMGT